MGQKSIREGDYHSSQTFRPFRALLTSSVSLPVIMAKRQDPNKRNHQTWSKRKHGSKEKARPKLTEAQLKSLAQKMQARFHWDEEPRFFQLEGVHAQLEGVDAIIQAPTGSGKTAIAAGPYVWSGNEGKCTLMICPLLALENEMV